MDLKGETFTNMINNRFINIPYAHFNILKILKQRKESNDYQINKGRRRRVSPKCLPSSGIISLSWIDLVIFRVLEPSNSIFMHQIKNKKKDSSINNNVHKKRKLIDSSAS